MGCISPGEASHVATNFTDLVSYPAAEGYTRYWDPVAAAPYLYNATTHVFISYDDPESLTLKCAYVRKHKLGGVMFWDYENDSSGTLLQTLHTELSR